jgi:hypothetical protein
MSDSNPPKITEKLWANKDLILGILIGAVVGYLFFKLRNGKKRAVVVAPQQPQVQVPGKFPDITVGATMAPAAAPSVAGVATFDNLGDLVGSDGMGDLEKIEYLES